MKKTKCKLREDETLAEVVKQLLKAIDEQIGYLE